jgi:hypothetical protein
MPKYKSTALGVQIFLRNQIFVQMKAADKKGTLSKAPLFYSIEFRQSFRNAI